MKSGKAQLAQSQRPVMSQASQRSRSSAIKDAASHIMQSPSQHGSALGQKGDDYWTKIIMHNVEQFQKEKDAVRAKVRENQTSMRDELLRQMEAHKKVKQDEKKHDLEYFDVIRRAKDDLAREEQEKRDSIRQRVVEQKLVRDRQIQEHAEIKYQARKEKKEDHETLRKLEKDNNDQQARVRDLKKQT